MSTYSALVLASTPAVYYRLGESVGPTATDSSGNARNGTYTNSPTLGVTGIATETDTAATFASASSQYVAPSYTFNSASATVEAWIKISGAPASDQLIAGCVNGLGSTTADKLLYVHTDGKLYFYAFDGAGKTTSAPTATIPTGQWVHVAGVANGTNLFAYVNGVQVGSVAAGATFAGYGTNNVFVSGTVGAGPPEPALTYFTGSLDEVAFYPSALSAATLLSHYTAGTPAPPLVGTRTVLPPLGLSVEVTLADGSRKRWDSDTRAADRPQGLQFRTRQGDGFSDASCTLARRIDTDYVDLNLLDDVAFVGDDGATAYEGRVAGIPRSFGDMHSVIVNCAGWMAHARDRKFTEIYIDRDLGDWQPMPLTRRVQIAGGQVVDADYTWEVSGGGMIFNGSDGKAIQINSTTEAWYAAPSGLTVGHVAYIASETNVTNVASAELFVASDETAVTSETYTLTADGTLRGQTPTTSRRYLMLRARASATHTPAAGTQFSRRFSAIAVYGNHGLTRRTIDSTTPSGLYASDVITNIASRFCPRLNTTGVQATTFPISHLTFRDPTDPYDAFLDVNKYHLWDLGVWENKTLTFRPNDLSDYDWEIRLSDLGTTIDLQGDSADDLANGIVVNYTDVATGKAARLTPTDDTTLADTSVSNPVNTHGLTKWTELTLSAPTTAVAAAQIGRIALAEFNLPKAPGTITVMGHIKDRAGHWQQGWRVRAGDTVAITDHPSDRPRLITETTWDHDSKTLTISVEGPAHRLDAVLDRITTDLVAANLSS